MYNNKPYNLRTLDRIDFLEAFTGMDHLHRERYVFLFKGFYGDRVTSMTFVFDYRKKIQEADFLQADMSSGYRKELKSYFYQGKEAMFYFSQLAEPNKVKFLFYGYNYLDFLRENKYN